MKLRGGSAELRVETGSWCDWDDQICKICDAGEVEDVGQFLPHYACMVEKANGEVDGGNRELEHEARVLEKLYRRRFAVS